MPNFFDYPKILKEELRNLGYKVDFFDDRPSTNAWIKAIVRINKNLIGFTINKYFDSIMEVVSHKYYDIVLLISGQSLSLSEDMIERIRLAQPGAKFILYQWDSQKNFPYIKKMQKFFDKCYSFDKKDVDDNPMLKFLPLFYSNTYEEIGKRSCTNFKYDFSFVGTAHPRKYEFVKKISKQLKILYPNQFIYFFFPSRLVYFYRKIFNKELKHAKYREFHFEPLSRDEISKLFEESKCIIDSAQSGQVGLTIRAIESLGAKRKLITTNEDIVNYDFYTPENIYIYKNKIDFDDVFFKKEYIDVDKNIYEKYSIINWLKKILE